MNNNKGNKIFTKNKFSMLPYNYRFLCVSSDSEFKEVSKVTRVRIDKIQNKYALRDIFYKSIYRIDL